MNVTLKVATRCYECNRLIPAGAQAKRETKSKSAMGINRPTKDDYEIRTTCSPRCPDVEPKKQDALDHCVAGSYGTGKRR